tara:strand:+ start:2022 stop:2789 length:768 start_codon:yes stop_codon:yes gene_type:complete
LFFKSFLILGFLSFSLRADTFPGGWMWYQDPVIVQEPKPQKEPESSPKKEVLPDIEALTPAERRGRALGRRFEAQIATALENPTFENVQKAQQFQREILARADRFQQLWQQVSLLDPETYEPDENPNTAFRVIHKRLKKETLEKKLALLSKEWGLFFLFRKGCPYCDKFAPHVKRLEAYGFEIKAVSADGGAMELFPKASPDNGAMAALNPRGIYPSLLLANPATGAVIPVSWGLTSYSQLLENFEIVLQTLEAS